jgi:hypothetical protein
MILIKVIEGHYLKEVLAMFGPDNPSVTRTACEVINGLP